VVDNVLETEPVVTVGAHAAYVNNRFRRTNVELPLDALFGTMIVTVRLAPEPPKETFATGTRVAFDDDTSDSPSAPVPSFPSPIVRFSVTVRAVPAQIVEAEGPVIVGVWLSSKTLTEELVKQLETSVASPPYSTI
jgi:hypothetical protein